MTLKETLVMGKEESALPSAWTDQDSNTFLDYGRYFVPEREVQIETICDVISPPTGSCHLVDLCCGEGLLSRALLDRFPTCYVHGLDGSPVMLERAKASMASFGDRFLSEVFDLAASGWRTFPYPVHAIVSSLAIHHLDPCGKELLFRDMFKALTPGGVLVIADLVQPASPLGIELAGKAWDAATRHQSIQFHGNLEPYEYFLRDNWNLFNESEPDPIDKPSPLFHQLKWLDDAGFTDVDVFWFKAGHAIFGGSKPRES